MSGVIHPRIMKGKEEPFPAIHFVAGGAWDVPTIGGHLEEGARDPRNRRPLTLKL